MPDLVQEIEMKKLIVISALLALTACGGGGGGSSEAPPTTSPSTTQPEPVTPPPAQPEPPATPTNAAPVADAGTAQKVPGGTTVTLNGSASKDAEGDALTYSWTLVAPSGSAAVLSDPKVASPTFIGDVAGVYTATLVVNDGKVNSDPATVTVTVDTVVGYDSITPLPYNMPSLGLEAYSFSSIGDSVVLKSGSPLNLHSIQIGMSSWACETGNWTAGCVTTPGATFNVPITITVFNSSGNQVATKTQNFDIPYRPSPDATCTDVLRWKAPNGVCYNGFAHPITFDLSALGVILPDSKFSYQVSYNTRSHGPAPLGVTGPYDSLNVGLFAVSSTPSVGTNQTPGFILESGVSTDEGYNIMARVVMGAQ